jgi:hypothetical protein
MADKHYAQAIQRALDEEIAGLVGQAPAKKEERAPARSRQAPEPVPQTAVGGSPPPPPLEDIAPPQPQGWATPAPGGSAGEYAAPPAPAQAAPAASASAPAAPPRFGAAPQPVPTQTQIVAGLDQRVARLMQVRDWISEDGDIARLIDTVIGRQVQSSEKRQARFSIILNVIFLGAGWALSVVASPTVLSNIFQHH